MDTKNVCLSSASTQNRVVERKHAIGNCNKTTLLKPTLSLGRTEKEHFRRIASLTPNSRRILSHLRIAPINTTIPKNNDSPLPMVKVKLSQSGSSKYNATENKKSLDYKPELVQRKVNHLPASKRENKCPKDIKHSTALNIHKNDISSNKSTGSPRHGFGTNIKKNFKSSPVSYIRHSETATDLTFNSICEKSDSKKIFFKRAPSSYAIDPVFTTSIDSMFGKDVARKLQSKVIKKSPTWIKDENNSAFNDLAFESIHTKSSAPYISIPNISTDLTIESIRDKHNVIYQSESCNPSTVSYVLKRSRSSDLTVASSQPNISCDSTFDYINENPNLQFQNQSPLTFNLKRSKYLTTDSASSSNASFNLNDLSIENISHPRNASKFTPTIPSPLASAADLSKSIRQSAPNGRSTPIRFMTDLSIESIHSKSSLCQKPKSIIRQYNRRASTKPLANRKLTSLKVSTSTPNKSPRVKSVWTITPTKDGSPDQSKKENAMPIRPTLLGRINSLWIQTPPRPACTNLKRSKSLKVGLKILFRLYIVKYLFIHSGPCPTIPVSAENQCSSIICGKCIFISIF